MKRKVIIEFEEDEYFLLRDFLKRIQYNKNIMPDDQKEMFIQNLISKFSLDCK